MARQTRLSFTHSVIKTCYPMELLHVDVWGPYRHKTRNDCTMCLTIVDDFTRRTWLYLLKCKSDYATIIQNFVAFVEKQFNVTVKGIRSDNAKELCEGDALKF